jgi:hypothetical protein
VSWECSCGPYDGVFHDGDEIAKRYGLAGGLSKWVKTFPPADEPAPAEKGRG